MTIADRPAGLVGEHDRADVAIAHQRGDLAAPARAGEAVTTDGGHDLASSIADQLTAWQ